MSEFKLKLSYSKLSYILLEEINNFDLRINSFPIKLENLKISYQDNCLCINSLIDSTVNFNVSSILKPVINSDGNLQKFELRQIKFKAKNILVKGVLQAIKKSAKSKIQELLAQPLDVLLGPVKKKMDDGIKNYDLPMEFKFDIKTHSITPLKLEILPAGIHLTGKLRQTITIKERIPYSE